MFLYFNKFKYKFNINFKNFLFKTNFFFFYRIKTFFYFLILYLYKFSIYFARKWLYTTNHKKIGLNYFFLAFLGSMVGTFLALLIRLELSTPGSFLFTGDFNRYILVVTAHGLIMVFFL